MEILPLSISGMSCEACVGHVKRALSGVDGVDGVEVDLANGRAAVRHHGANVAQLVAAVADEGYEARPLTPGH